jgi:ketosteroid isomerase-like protein
MQADDAARIANRAALERAMSGITALDLAAVVAELDDDLVMQLPFEGEAPDMDKTQFGELLATMFAMYERFDINIVEIVDLVDPNRLVARYESDCLVRARPITYANSYVGFFEFSDGKITAWREYDNPLNVQAFLSALAS